MQRHYVMYYEMSYGLNVEMHKQTEIAKRLNAIIAQVLPFLAQEHQQQVATAVERAKQVTMTELNAIIGQQQQQGLQQLLQQIHAQQLPHGPPGLPMGPHPPASLLGFPANPPPHPLLKAAELHAAREPVDLKGPPSLPEDRLRSSVSPGEKYRPRSPAEGEVKRRKHEKLQPHRTEMFRTVRCGAEGGGELTFPRGKRNKHGAEQRSSISSYSQFPRCRNGIRPFPAGNECESAN
ncbi:hypothetical protein J6590_019141 [Homalodisca vitripennis]|nr:hypothetical protein J6590_019141 [Homalodisca vitripennis]